MRDQAVERRVAELCNVSRETIELLARLAELLAKWSKKINLVAPSTVPDLWTRHILDSAQLMPLIPPNTRRHCDIGTGGGFPGLVVAILAKETHPSLQVTMIESDKRKCAFLQSVSGELDLGAVVIPKRIEAVNSQGADIVSSRALASLSQLLGLADQHLATRGKALFLKGAKFEAEVEEALASWSFDLQKRTSETSADAVVLEISSLRSK